MQQQVQNDANWAAMNKPNTAQVINANMMSSIPDIHLATSLPAKFVVKMFNQRNQLLQKRQQE